MNFYDLQYDMNLKCKENTNETFGTIVRVFITSALGIYLDVLSLTGSRASTTLDRFSLSRDPAAYVVPDDGPVVMETVLPRVHRTRQTGLERL